MPSKIDLANLHHEFKGNRFRGVELNDIRTGEHGGFVIIAKKRGRGHHWSIIGDSDGPIYLDSLEEAKSEARRLQAWADKEREAA